MTKMTSKCHQNDAQVQTGVGLGLEVFGSQAELDTRFPQVRLLEGEEAVSCHNIAGIWVAFFSRCQRYRCGQVLTDGGALILASTEYDAFVGMMAEACEQMKEAAS